MRKFKRLYFWLSLIGFQLFDITRLLQGREIADYAIIVNLILAVLLGYLGPEE